MAFKSYMFPHATLCGLCCTLPLFFHAAAMCLAGQHNGLTHIFNNVLLLLLKYWNISNECSLFSLFSRWIGVCKCLYLFECSQATSGWIVACKPVEEVPVYSTMINQRARERGWKSRQLQWPKAKNPREKYSYPQLNIFPSLTMIIVNEGDLSWADLVGFQPSVFARLQSVGSDVQVSLNARLSWPLQGAAGNIFCHLSTFLVQYTELRGSNLLPPHQLQT